MFKIRDKETGEILKTSDPIYNDIAITANGGLFRIMEDEDENGVLTEWVQDVSDEFELVSAKYPKTTAYADWLERKVENVIKDL